MMKRMGGTLTVRLARESAMARLVDVDCTLGRADKAYPEEHHRGAWTVAFVRRGTFRYRAADTNRLHALRPGWILLGRPGAEYECSHDHDGGDCCTSIAIAEDAVHEAMPATRLGTGATPAAVLPPLPRVMAWLERVRARDDVDLDEVALRVAAAIAAQADRPAPAPLVDRARHRGPVDAAIDAIDRDCVRSWSLPSLAAVAGLSPFHFLRVFRTITGTTPHQYLVGARIRRASQLLLDTGRPVTDVAYDVGFSDLSNFVRTFHREIGCSPRAYRRSPPPRPEARPRPAAPRALRSGSK
jgi:AraC-like DNA-binding protein